VEDVTVRDLIINYFYVYKIFFGKTIPENRKKKKNSAIINSIRTGVNVRIAFFRENPVIFRILFRVTITLNDSIKFRGFIDFGVEITYKQLTGVIIILNLNMEMISHSNYRVSFMGICENVRLAIRPIEYEVYLFIIDVKTSYFLMLGALFIFQSNLNFGTEEDTGRQFGIIKNIDRRLTVRFYTGLSNNVRRR
jgi:hypothetical protein